jgi:hypothetical protein
MAVISRAIPTLLRGVSQAADLTKQPDHADIQENANSSPVQGLIKRSGSQYITNISNSTLGNVHIQTINRDVSERYIAVFSNNDVKVYDLAGNEKTVNKPDGVTYLATTNPRNEIKTVTIADYTFVVNTSITVAMDTAVSQGSSVAALVFVNQVTADTDYSVTVDSTTATYNTGTSNLKTSTIAADLKSDLDGGLSGFTVTQNGPVLWIRKNDGSNFSIDATDSQGNSQITLVKNSVQTFTDLPTTAPNNFVVEVKGDDTTNFDNYYVKFVTNNGGTFEEGQWEESLKAGITYKFNYDKMPHILLRQADGNFRLARADGDTYTISSVDYKLPKWGERTVGDEDTAPNPTLVDTKINNVFFFRNRLGFLAEDNVCMSRVSEFFDFYPETVTTIIDSDPIDIAASHTKVSILKHAVTMGEQLILFSDQTQFILESSIAEALTPKTANVTVATEFENNTAATPVGAGSSIYFLTKKGSFSGVREYITQEDVNIKDAADTTVHVPRYIENGIFKMAVSTNENILVLLGADSPNKLYVNRWLYGNNFEKVLNSWCTYTFNSAKSIRNIDFIDTDLYLVVEEANGTTLEKIPFEADYKETNATFEYHLDHKVTEATTGVSKSYSSSTGLTTFTLPYRLNGEMNIVGRYLGSGETSTYVNAQGATVNLKPGQVLQTTNTSDGSTTTITATGNFTNSKFIVGEPFEMHYRFSQQRLTQGEGAGSELISGRLQLHHFYIKYEDTGFFKVEVTPDHRDTSTHTFSGNVLGASSSTIGSINLATGMFRVPVMSKADRVNIDIKNNTFLPTQLASAEYEAMFHMRSRRI